MENCKDLMWNISLKVVSLSVHTYNGARIHKRKIWPVNIDGWTLLGIV